MGGKKHMALFGNIFGKREKGADALKDAAVGQNIVFGVFPQGKDGKKLSPISWQVLDRKGDRVLLISKYTLACLPFNTAKTTWDGKIGWEKSSLRTWLNGEFLNRFFTPEERNRIADTDVTADPNPDHGEVDPGSSTKDRVFLLSIREAENFFPDQASRKCQLSAFAIACGAWTSNTSDKGNGRWWLRTPGYNQNRASCVECDGGILTGGTEVDDGTSCCIRPVIWVNV